MLAEIRQLICKAGSAAGADQSSHPPCCKTVLLRAEAGQVAARVDVIEGPTEVSDGLK